MSGLNIPKQCHTMQDLLEQIQLSIPYLRNRDIEMEEAILSSLDRLHQMLELMRVNHDQLFVKRSDVLRMLTDSLEFQRDRLRSDYDSNDEDGEYVPDPVWNQIKSAW